MAVTFTDEDRGRAKQLHEWHYEWSGRQIDAGVDGPVPDHRPEESDYNQHVPDLEADGEAMDEFVARANEIMGVGQD